MSFQRRVILPPLALAVHPAPPPKKVEKKDKDDKEKEKAKKEVKKDDKQPEEKVDAEDNLVDLRSDKKEPAKAKAIGGGDQASPTNVPPRQPQVTGDRVAEGVTPDSPASMVPEPGTPGSAGPQPGTPALAAPGATDDVPRVPPPQTDPKSPKGDSKPTTGDNKDDKESKDKEDEPEVPPPPLRLLGPVPHRPIRTKLDLNPASPYPPINTDPRGAYYKYAKFNQGEWMMIDVTKDGWLSEQWREKGEREALARLRGESEVVAKREAEKIKRMESIRKVPDTADGILLELWNDLVEALNHEVGRDLAGKQARQLTPSARWRTFGRDMTGRPLKRRNTSSPPGELHERSSLIKLKIRMKRRERGRKMRRRRTSLRSLLFSTTGWMKSSGQRRV